jgi:hypothetical protein
MERCRWTEVRAAIAQDLAATDVDFLRIMRAAAWSP